MIELRPDQERAVSAFFDFFATGDTKDRNPTIGMPTGYGKSPVQAEIVKRSLNWWPDTRILCITHRKKLIQQNFNSLLRMWPTAPAGIYSAGLKRRDTMHPIIFGGVMSIRRILPQLGFRHFMIVDEAHLVSPEEERVYAEIIAHFKSINPYFVVLGLSATLYRTGSGPLEDGGIFTECVFDCTSLDQFNRILDEGWLCRLIPQATSTELSVEGVGWKGNDYDQTDAQAAVDKPDLTLKIVREIIAAKQADHRRSCLIFSQGVAHAEHIRDCLRMNGQHAEVIHQGVDAKLQDEYLASFENGTLPYLVNNDILTTGFDMPALDMIAVVRLIGSPGLWVQILGRLTRPFYAWLVSQTSVTPEAIADRLAAIAASHKPNGLVLDFGANTARLGTINNPMRPRKRKRGSKPGVAPVKLCPKCKTYNFASATKCCNPACDAEFSREQKLFSTASDLALITASTPIVEKQFALYDVTNVIYSKLGKEGEKQMMRVSYFIAQNVLHPIRKNVCLEHGGSLRKDAVDWWSKASDKPIPKNTAEALKLQTDLRKPRQIRVWTNTKYPDVTEYIY